MTTTIKIVRPKAPCQCEAPTEKMRPRAMTDVSTEEVDQKELTVTEPPHFPMARWFGAVPLQVESLCSKERGMES